MLVIVLSDWLLVLMVLQFAEVGNKQCGLELKKQYELTGLPSL